MIESICEGYKYMNMYYVEDSVVFDMKLCSQDSVVCIVCMYKRERERGKGRETKYVEKFRRLFTEMQARLLSPFYIHAYLESKTHTKSSHTPPHQYSVNIILIAQTVWPRAEASLLFWGHIESCE